MVQQTAEAVNITTVYRTLELLEELGLVTHTHLSHGAPTYHPAQAHPHIHLVCRDCGTVTEAEPATMQPVVDRLQTEHGFEVDVTHVSLFGRCGQCEASG